MAITPVAGVTHQAVLKYGPPGSPSYVGLMLPERDLSNFTIEPYTPFAPANRQGEATVRDFNIASVWELNNDFGGGTGRIVEGKVEANTYAYARGNNITGGLGTCLYTSQKGRILPAPASAAAGTLVVIKQFIEFTLSSGASAGQRRLFALTNENPGKIYMFDSGGTTPTLVETLNLNANTTGLQLWTDGTTLYCTRGPSQQIRQTTDGTTWTNNPSSEDFIEMREGGVYVFVTGATIKPGGTEGYPNATVGLLGSKVTNIAMMEKAVLIGKPEGLFSWSQGVVTELFATPWAYDTNNFSKMVVHNGLVYFNVKNKLYYSDLTNVVEIVPKDVGGFKSIDALASSHGPLFIGAKITPIPAFATSAGPNNVGATTDITDAGSGGTVAWTDPGNARLSDSVYATAVFSSPPLFPQVSHYLKALNFGFAIPSSAAITGIKVEIQKAATTAGSIIDFSVRLIKGGIISGYTNLYDNTWPTAETYFTYGGSNDLWGLSLTPADVNATNFGMDSCF